MLTILLAMGGAMCYSFTSFIKKYEAGQKFNGIKLIATLIVGAVIGFIARNTPLAELNEQFIVAQLALYSGFVVVAENILKIVWRFILKLKHRGS